MQVYSGESVPKKGRAVVTSYNKWYEDIRPENPLCLSAKPETNWTRDPSLVHQQRRTQQEQGKRKGKSQNVIGDCVHWTTKSQCQWREMRVPSSTIMTKETKVIEANLIFLANPYSKKKFKKVIEMEKGSSHPTGTSPPEKEKKRASINFKKTGK